MANRGMLRALHIFILIGLATFFLCDGNPSSDRTPQHLRTTNKLRAFSAPGAISRRSLSLLRGLHTRPKRAVTRRCSSDLPLCRCHKKGTVICNQVNCIQNLPTTNMTRRDGELIRNIVVSRQINFTFIKFKDLQVLPNLRSARFFKNGLYSINSQAFQWTPNIERLDLHRNQMRYFPSAIRMLPNLRRLNLGGNKITSIAAGTFNYNPKLQQLILKRNHLEWIPAPLPPSLVKLSIGQNLISQTGDLRHLVNLRILRLDSNRFREISSNDLPVSLRELSLCSNLLSSRLPLSVANLINLRRLQLAGNPDINRIGSDVFFRSTSKLEQLDLRRSHVADIETDAFIYFPHLQVAELEGNSLSAFNQDWFANNPLIRKVSLAGNSWNCDCDFINSLADLTTAVEDEIEQQSNDGLTKRDVRMGQFVNDFTSIVCGTVDSKLSPKIDWRKTVNRNFSSIDPTSCFRTGPKWRFRLSAASAHKQKPNVTFSNTEERTSTIKSRIITTTTTTTALPSTTKSTTTSTPTPTTSTPTTITSTPTTTTTTTTTTPTTTTTTPTTTTTTSTTTSTTPTTTTTTPTTTTTTLTTTSTTPTTTSSTSTTTSTTPTTTTTTPTTTTTTSTLTKKHVTTTTTVSESPRFQVPERRCTNGGNECQFPFDYRGSIYNDCVSKFLSSTQWCYTNIERGDWDYCTECVE